MKNAYEFVFLLQEDIEPVQKTLKTIVKDLKGEVKTEKPWGEKKLAYPIRKKTTATFFEWVIELEASALTEFKKKLSFEEKLIRYLLLKKD